MFLLVAKDAGVELRTLQASTCRTYVNAIATAYRMAGKGRFAPSNEAHFPRCNVFVTQCLKRLVQYPGSLKYGGIKVRCIKRRDFFVHVIKNTKMRFIWINMDYID